MRASLASRTEPLSAVVNEYSRLGWLQAGFSSFAYRLAHLRVPRFALLGVMSVLFLLA
jgi:hypothetical protein